MTYQSPLFFNLICFSSASDVDIGMHLWKTGRLAMWWSMGSTIFAFQYFTYIFIDCLWCHSGCACNICIFFYLDIIVLFSRHLHSFIAHEISGLVGPVYSLWQIGIDLEEKQRRLKSDILSFARRYFSTFEVEFLQAIADPENQRQEFVKLWTLKVRFLNVLISLSSPDFFCLILHYYCT